MMNIQYRSKGVLVRAGWWLQLRCGNLSLSDPAGLNWAFEDCMYYAALTTEGLAKGNHKINRLRVTSERTLGDQSEEVSFVRGKGKYL